MTPHPEVVAKRKAVDMSDLEADPIIMWQKRQEAYSFVHIILLFSQYYKKKKEIWKNKMYIKDTFIVSLILSENFCVIPL